MSVQGLVSEEGSLKVEATGSRVSRVWQLALHLGLTYDCFQQCGSSYSTTQKHRWVKWLAQEPTYGKFMTKIQFHRFSSKIPSIHYCRWLHKMKNTRTKNCGSWTSLYYWPLHIISWSVWPITSHGSLIEVRSL
jgi:hypothetical protein